jgi:hypothetical protein
MRDSHQNGADSQGMSPAGASRSRGQMLRQLKADIEAIDAELAVYEEKYKMSSKAFYATYARGTDGRLSSPDFAAWSDLYLARMERQALYRQMLYEPEA